jgi:hypothetical protein
MRLPLLLATAASLAIATPALAASSQSPNSASGSQPAGQSASAQTGSGSQSGAAAQSGSPQSLAAAKQIRQDLESAGFQDVNVVAESFVVQAKTKEGNPVVMTIGPHGMSVFEAMNAGKAQGSNSTASNSASSGSSGSTVQK